MNSGDNFLKTEEKMKYLLLIALLTGCTMSSENEINNTREVLYQASKGIADVMYCDEDGRLVAELGVDSFEKMFRAPVNTTVCLIVSKRGDLGSKTMYAKIFIDGYLMYSDSDNESASAGGVVPEFLPIEIEKGESE